jgi:hypothetical protein
VTALPIVTRELRVVARRASTYWMRVGVVFMSSAIGAYALLMLGRANMGALGKQVVYSMLSSMVGIYALFTGIRNTADVISIEKREGTLGLLFLTDLRGYDVALGKLCSAAIRSLYAMMAAFPVLGVALIGGGITGMEFVRGSLALLNVVFFAHAAGLCVSAFSWNGRRAISAGIAIALFFMWGLPAITAFLIYKGWLITSEWLSLFSPLTALHLGMSSMPITSMAISVVSRIGPNVFWQSLLCSQLLGWTFLLIACWKIPRAWQNAGVTVPWRERVQRFWHGSMHSRTIFRRKLVGVNPFYWLVSRTRFDALAISVMIVGAALGWNGIWIWANKRFGGGPLDYVPMAISTAVVLHLYVRVAMAASASRHFAEQRRSGGLELLLSCTPLSVREILRGQWLALRRQYLFPVVFILLVDAVFLFCIRNRLVEFVKPTYLFMGGMMVMLVADVFAIGWVGMWVGLSDKRANRASGGTIARVMAMPVLLFYLITSWLAWKSRTPFVIDERTMSVLIVRWFIIGFLFDVGWILYARWALYARFRQLAATPYPEQTGIMAVIGRLLGNVVRTRRQRTASLT